jgi:hypothetical protein
VLFAYVPLEYFFKFSPQALGCGLFGLMIVEPGD